MKPQIVEVISEAEAQAARDQVHALRALWSKKSPFAEFYILGASAYAEAQQFGGLAYQMLAKKLNPVLEESFGPLYEKVRLKLEATLGAPIQYYPRLARPGFHIFQTALPYFQPHVDIPHTNLLWQAWEAVDVTKTLSFTLSLALPIGGGGLRIWDQIPPEEALKPDADPNKLIQGLEPSLLRYRLGWMALHHGYSIHQIAPFEVAGPGDERITLQGHAIHSSQGWLAYF
ncbi:MAG: hypothetical protein U1E65_04535 [Myxococcota bacterium]